ncbi:hypothetical protein DBV05_g4716 [Lasiodiplodia theobromae]|uniref:Uncharacterized protein n=1 Tax=Lasiodiplodia theobromae TaxID=45133 RepID=A0A5N5DFP5_9PEZI|nr:hypothetical protein DBV05_g4716 [Lasiodiplodia theobromae]
MRPPRTTTASPPSSFAVAATTTTVMATSDLPSLPSPPAWLLPFAIITFIVAMTAAVLVYHFTFHRGLDIEPEPPARSPSVVHATATAPAQAYLFSQSLHLHANDNHRSATGSGRLPLREATTIFDNNGNWEMNGSGGSIKARKYKTPKSRIQKIWEARMRAKAKRDAEAMTAAAAAAGHYKFARDRDDYVSRFVDEQARLLPQTPDRWGIDEGGRGGSAVEMRLRGRRQQADEVATTHARRGGRKRRLEGDFVPTPDQEPRLPYGGDGKRAVMTDEGEDGGGNGLLEKLNSLFERLVGYYEDDGGEEELVFPITEEERGGERVGWE